MSATFPDDRPQPRLRLSDRGHTLLCALWCTVAVGLFVAVVVVGPGNAVVADALVAVTVGTCCYLLAAMRA